MQVSAGAKGVKRSRCVLIHYLLPRRIQQQVAVSGHSTADAHCHESQRDARVDERRHLQGREGVGWDELVRRRETRSTTNEGGRGWR